MSSGALHHLIFSFQHRQYSLFSLLYLLFLCLNLILLYAMSVRRSKAMPTDGPTAKFLYTIIKQLDLKSVRTLSHKPENRS